MRAVLVVAAVLLLAVSARAASVGIGPGDFARFTSVLNAAASGDLTSACWAAQGLSALGQSVPQAACNAAKNANADDITSVYQAAVIAAAAGCKVSLSAEKTIKAALASNNAAQIHFAVVAAKQFGVDVDAEDVLGSLNKILGGEYTVGMGGHAFATAALLNLPAEKLKRTFDAVEDVIHQGEVSDNTFAFEGGIVNTAAVLEGAYKLAAVVDRAPALGTSEAVKLVNYLAANKFSSSVDQLASLAKALNVLATNKFHNPLLVFSDAKPLPAKSAALTVYVTNTLGGEVSDLSVTASVRDAAGKSVAGDKALSGAGNGKFSLAMGELARGEYKVTVSTKAGASKYIVKDKTLVARVVGAITVTDAQLSVSARTVKEVPAGQALTYPNTAAAVVKADEQQKIVFRFNLRDAATKAVTRAHQVFVRFTHKVTGNEVFFVATADASGQYVVDIDLGDKSTDSFDAAAGDYAMDLIVGDSSLESSIEWKVATVAVEFRTRRPALRPEPKEFFHARPEIHHTFREPESRPPAVVSLAFLVIVLSPILLLLVLWIRLDANISNFPGSPSAILFHVCIGAILYLYFQFWLNGNMFDTLKYLAVLSIPTLISGKFTLGQVTAKRATQASTK